MISKQTKKATLKTIARPVSKKKKGIRAAITPMGKKYFQSAENEANSTKEKLVSIISTQIIINWIREFAEMENIKSVDFKRGEI